MNYNIIRLVLLFLPMQIAITLAFAQNDSLAHIYVQDSSDTPGGLPDTIIAQSGLAGEGEALSKYKHSRDFGYMAYLDSFLRLEKNLSSDTFSIDENTGQRRKRTLGRSAGDSILNSLPLRIFFWIIALSFIIFICYRLFRNGQFAKKTYKLKENPRGEDVNPLYEDDEFTGLINEAESGGDFNLATRYLYLQTLRKLADKDLVAYSPDKTNNRYVAELAGKNYQSDFSALTVNYDYLWYGKFSITREKYLHLKDQFSQFSSKIIH